MPKSRLSLMATLLSIQFLVACAATEPKETPESAAPQQAEVALPSPDDADALYSYAVTLEEQGKDQEAMGYYLQATQVNPEHIKSHIALAQIYTKYNRTDEAKIAFENVLRLDRSHPFVAQYKEARLKYYSARNIAQNEEYEKALKLLGEAPRNTPLDTEIEAEEAKWREILQAGNATQKNQNLLEQASLLAYQGKYQEAMDLLKTAPDADSNPEIQEKMRQWQQALASRGSAETPVAQPSAAPAAQNTRYVMSDNVNLRQSPYLYAESLASLKNGAPVELLLDKGYEADGYQWSKVRTRDGKVGWIAASLLRQSLDAAGPKVSPPPSRPEQNTSAGEQSYGTRYVKGTGVNVRRSPSLSGTLVTRANAGAPVIVLSERNLAADGYNWTKVRLGDGQVGWIAADFLQGEQPAAGSSKPAAAAQPRQAQITATDVNLRSAPSVSASVVVMLSRPTKVTLLPDAEVTRDNYTWQHVQLGDGRKAWVVKKFLGPVSAGASSTETQRRYIRGDNVNIRKDPGTSAAILITATEGTAVTLMSSQAVDKDGYKWHKIRLSDGRLGWVASNFLGQ